jgi:hypothetical protein
MVARGTGGAADVQRAHCAGVEGYQSSSGRYTILCSTLTRVNKAILSQPRSTAACDVPPIKSTVLNLYRCEDGFECGKGRESQWLSCVAGGAGGQYGTRKWRNKAAGKKALLLLLVTTHAGDDCSDCGLGCDSSVFGFTSKYPMKR